jgi:hypothetical protein
MVMTSDKTVNCPGCQSPLTPTTVQALGGWDRSPTGDEFSDELHICSECNAWSMVTYVDRFAGPVEVKVTGPLSEEEVQQQRQRLKR